MSNELTFNVAHVTAQKFAMRKFTFITAWRYYIMLSYGSLLWTVC